MIKWFIVIFIIIFVLNTICIFQKYEQTGDTKVEFNIGDKMYYADIKSIDAIDKLDNEFIIKFITIEENDNVTPKSCAFIILNKTTKEAIINDIFNWEKCIQDKKNNYVLKSGEIIMKMIIIICKKYNMKNISLTDNSTFICPNGSKIHLLKGRTLIDGLPYYAKLGFEPKDKIDRDRMKNYDVYMNIIKTKTIDLKKIIRNTYHKLRETKDIEKKELKHLYNKFIDYIDDHKEDLLKKTLKKISFKSCIYYQNIYEEIYDLIGFHKYNSKVFELKVCELSEK